MSASYFGSFPVTRVLSDVVSEEGVRVITVSETHEESTAAAAVPAVHSLYSGNGNFSVTQANLTYTGNGLAEVVYSVAGPVDNPPALVQITSGAPLIYGLSPGIEPDSNGFPRYSAGGGQSVEVTFCDSKDSKETVIANNYRNPMPTEFLGVSLPLPARTPGPITEAGAAGNRIPSPDPFPGLPPPGFPQPSFSGYYAGFICTDVIMRQQGSALVVRLIYKESGWLTDLRNGRTIFYFN